MGLQTLSGKVKKIQKKEFLDMFCKGEFYPPEGCTIFSIDDSSIFYIYGGARAAKPGHWSMSNLLFQIQTSKVDSSDNTAHNISSFKMFNHSGELSNLKSGKVGNVAEPPGTPGWDQNGIDFHPDRHKLGDTPDF